jgi:diaminopimelate dehydrogenase
MEIYPSVGKAQILLKMKKIRAAVVGYGNVGRYVIEALKAAPDFQIAGIVRRDPLNPPDELAGYKVAGSLTELEEVDVAILCTPTRGAEKAAREALALGINTVDSFDVHSEIVELRERLGTAARKYSAVSIISAGWDPGSDSVVRALMEACAPKGLTYTNFGPGMSMGHTVAAKAVAGVKSALSITIPTGTGIHRRMVYVEIEQGHDLDAVSLAIKNDPYFIHDQTHVIQVESVDALSDMGHGVEMVRKGTAGSTPNQRFEFKMSINNPAVTAQVMVCCARAAMRQAPGAYTMIELPVVDLLPGKREQIIERLV